MNSIPADTWQKNGVEVINFSNEIWLNEKHIEGQLGRSTFQKTTLKYALELRKQRQEISEFKKQPCRRFIK